ncbi:hypothetical protein GQ54DRAFT_325839 [Martensiomyces pterosporus]|nr:hypothetical protein GQ54DRAFT_325839 [Martensiomyces pterosporus]
MRSYIARTDAASPAKTKRPRYDFLGIPEHVSSSSSEGEPMSSNSTLSTGLDYTTSALRFHALANRFDSSANAVACEGEVISDMIVSIGSHFRRYNQLVANIHSTFHELSRLCMERSGESKQGISDTTTHYLVEPLCPDPRYSSQPSALPRPPQSAISPCQPNAPGKPRQVYRPHTGAKSGKPAGSLSAKRPLSDFNFFCRDARKLVVEAHPEYTKEQDIAVLSRPSPLSKPVASGFSDGTAKPNGEAGTTGSANYKCHTAAAPLKAGLFAKYTSTSASDQVKQTIWRCVTADVGALSPLLPAGQVPAEGSSALPSDSLSNAHQHCRQFSAASNNALNAILNGGLGPETPEDADEPDEIDEPLAHSLLRVHSQTEQAAYKPSSQEGSPVSSSTEVGCSVDSSAQSHIGGNDSSIEYKNKEQEAMDAPLIGQRVAQGAAADQQAPKFCGQPDHQGGNTDAINHATTSLTALASSSSSSDSLSDQDANSL